MTAEQARTKRAEAVARRRLAEQTCRFDFIWRGGELHECDLPDDPCSRDYDPLPYPEARPSPEHAYAGTGIGALYGLQGSERHMWQLAGWNLAVAR